MSFEKPKSKLFRPDPYYIPGYCGYCPMQKYQLGETYGKTTANILTDPSIAKSGQLVLAEKKVRGEDGTNRVEDLQSMRDNSWGDRKLNSSMVPGYTGYIPKSEKYFGSRYAIICDKATNDIINRYNQCKMSKQNHENNQLPPLIPIRRDAGVYISTTQAQHSNSPYFMAIDNKDKSFISGYTGFIPRARSRYAKGYPDNTRDALIEFTNDSQRLKGLARREVQLVRPPQTIERNSDTKSLYDKGGLLPHYTGYLPGHKFRYALTYGNSSRNYETSGK